MTSKLDVIWLKRDVRLHDHAAFSAVAGSTNPFIVLYLYEPDQLQQPTVHGSHIKFYNEGLIELDGKLSGFAPVTSRNMENGSDDNDGVHKESTKAINELHAITVCYANCVATLMGLHQIHPIGRLLAHEETGHFASYQRDRRVRRWCKENNIKCVEFQQSGAIRRLKDRDDFSAKLNAFLGKPQYPTVDPAQIRSRLVTDIDLPGRCGILNPLDISEIPEEHTGDRDERQKGGENAALDILKSFLYRRGEQYQKGISSPNSSWSSCSRLSPYLAWGQVSLRRVVQATKQRQAEIKEQRAVGVPLNGGWGRALGAFLSRLHWRSHFIQKLETEPLVEKRAMHPAYQHLRRQDGDWNQYFYDAWAAGQTGFPFVDACMRCLHKHGWINFRMRAMLVSFATYNLWLDWKKIAPHLARLFLDYEPGIHYPQLQMQSGTTGINAMRVYNVTKQGKDQDPNGVFIRKYVPELRQVPNEHIHEPWKMSLQLQRKLKIRVATSEDEGEGIVYYQKPIVDEKETAKVAKDAISAVRKQVETREVAGQVYQKHGSRKGPSDFGSSEKMHPSSATKKRGIALEGQQSIKNFASNDFRSVGSQPSSETKKLKVASDPQRSIRMFATAAFSNSRAAGEFKSKTQLELAEGVSAPAKEKICSAATNAESSRERKQACGALDCFVEVEGQEGGCKPASDGSAKAWSCKECTFENHKPHAPVCEMCGTLKVL